MTLISMDAVYFRRPLATDGTPIGKEQPLESGNIKHIVAAAKQLAAEGHVGFQVVYRRGGSTDERFHGVRSDEPQRYWIGNVIDPSTIPFDKLPATSRKGLETLLNRRERIVWTGAGFTGAAENDIVLAPPK